MSAFTPEFLPIPAASPATANHAGFIPLSFRRKRMSELCEGYYCIELTDGRTEFVEAASALDALRLAQGMGSPVLRVQRESLQRRRMVRELVNPDLAADAEEELIKPGTVLVSFETLCAWQDKKDGIVADVPVAPALATAPEPEPEPVMAEAAPSTAGEVAAGILAKVRGEPESDSGEA